MKADHLLFGLKTITDSSYYTSSPGKSLEQKADEFSQKAGISALRSGEWRRTPGSCRMLADFAEILPVTRFGQTLF
jgi:hypothetical protein